MSSTLPYSVSTGSAFNAFDKLHGIKNYANWRDNMQTMLVSLRQWGLIDGVSVHKGLGARRSKTQYSCFPMEIIILNLSPTIRTQDRYVFSLGVIPGPREPKHFNSFCWPLYQECLRGLEGIPTYHTILRDFFPLHVYLVHLFGDLIAMIRHWAR